MTDIQNIGAFAVLDLETTNIPALNFDKANITEISVHAFSKEDLKISQNCEIPRVHHKLTLLCNPAGLINPDAERISGLDNYMLEKECKFDKNTAELIIAFLNRLQQPVCLVAHNGEEFDFKIIKTSLLKLNMELPASVVCVDTLKAFRSLDEEEKDQTDLGLAPPLIPPFELKVGTKNATDEVIDVIDVIEKGPLESFTLDEIKKSNEDVGNTNEDYRKLNETTPKRKPNAKLLQNIKCMPNETKKHIKIDLKSKRTLFSPSTKPPVYKTPYGHYKLENVYERIFKKKPTKSHHAEADVLTLEEILMHYRGRFIQYAEKNAIPFSVIPKLGRRM